MLVNLNSYKFVLTTITLNALLKNMSTFIKFMRIVYKWAKKTIPKKKMLTYNPAPSLKKIELFVIPEDDKWELVN